MIRPELSAYIRTLILGDGEAHERVQEQLNVGGWDGFPRFLAALFFLAVDRKFGGTATSADVTSFVAELRSELARGGPDIILEDAEVLIRANLDPTIKYKMAPEMVGRVQAATVYKILVEEKLSDSELEEFLAEAMRVASRP